MDETPYTGDLDLAAVRTHDDLLARLRTVYIRADKPALRALEAKTRHNANPLSKNAVAEMLRGARFPRKAVMLSFLRACGVPDNALEPWQRAWEKAAASGQASTLPADEMGLLHEQLSQLREENHKLNTRLSELLNASAQASSPEPTRLLKEISRLRSLLASVAESVAYAAPPDVDLTLPLAQPPGREAESTAGRSATSRSISPLDVLIRASIGTLLNEHGEVSVPRLLREIARGVHNAGPAVVATSLEDLRRSGKITWQGTDVLKAEVITVLP